MKRKLVLGLSLVLLISIIIFSLYRIHKNNSKTYFFQITYEEFMDKYDSKEEFILLVYRENCYQCDEYIETINKASKSLKRTVFYIDTNDIKKAEDYSNLWNITDVSGTPALIKFSDQKVEKSKVGSMTKDQVIKFIKD